MARTGSILASKTLVALVALAQFVYLLLDIGRGLSVYDEGITLYGAQRVLNGDLPYRDFWTVYAPGQFNAVATLFSLFGASVLVERLWDIAVRLATALVAYLLVRWMASPGMGLVASLLATVALLPVNFYYGYAAFPSLLFCLLSLLFLLGYFRAPGRGPLWLLLAGVAVGAATLFRHDFGLYCLVSTLASLLLFAFLHRGESGRSDAAVRPVLLLPAGALAVVVPVAIYFVALVPLGVLWSDLVTFPTQVLPGVRALPYPPLIPGSVDGLGEWLVFYFPVLACVAGLVAVVLFLKLPGKRTDARYYIATGLGLLGLFLFIQALNRNHPTHLAPSYLAAIVLLVALLPEVLKSIPARVGRVVLSLGVAAGTLYYAGQSVFEELQTGTKPGNVQCLAGFDWSRCIPVNADQAAAVSYIQAHTSPGEAIFVGRPRHDRIFVNDVSFYFLAGRPSATPYQELHPGLATTRPVQEEIVRDLEARHVRYVVIYSGFENHVEPNGSSMSSGVTVLDDYIRQQYDVVAQYGLYSIESKRMSLPGKY